MTTVVESTEAALAHALQSMVLDSKMQGLSVWVVREADLQTAFGLTAAAAVEAFRGNQDFKLSSCAAATPEMGEMLLIGYDADQFERFLRGEVLGSLVRLGVSRSSPEQPIVYDKQTSH